MKKAPGYFASLKVNLANLSKELDALGWEHKIYTRKKDGWELYYINVKIPNARGKYPQNNVTKFMSLSIKNLNHMYNSLWSSIRLIEGRGCYRMRLSYTKKELEQALLDKLEEL